jgi:hypothetical protein
MKKINQYGGWKIPLFAIQGSTPPPPPLSARVIAPTITLMTGMFADNTAIDESLHYAFAHKDFAEIDVASYSWSVTNLTHPSNTVYNSTGQASNVFEFDFTRHATDQSILLVRCVVTDTDGGVGEGVALIGPIFPIINGLLPHRILIPRIGISPDVSTLTVTVSQNRSQNYFYNGNGTGSGNWSQKTTHSYWIDWDADGTPEVTMPDSTTLIGQQHTYPAPASFELYFAHDNDKGYDCNQRWI